MKIIWSHQGKESVQEFNTDTVLVGRGNRTTGGPDLDLSSDSYVSRRHAIITARLGVFYIEDLGSKLGTTVNDEPIQEQGEWRLRPGDVIKVGDTTLRVEASSITPSSQPETVLVAAEGTGEPHLIEINRRITPGSHRGEVRKVDLWAALYARMQGMPSPTRSDVDPGEEGIAVFFPEEWLRDPGSRYLREYPVDVPWDEPELIEALLALRHER